MRRFLLHSKIHRAYVTGAELDYVGSIGIDSHLMKEAGILPFEKVQVVNVNNGARWETYAIEAPPYSGTIDVRGAGARLVNKRDVLIIMTYVEIEDPVPASFKPTVVMVDERNRLTEIYRMGSDAQLHTMAEAGSTTS